jgi:hypothetical protein
MPGAFDFLAAAFYNTHQLRKHARRETAIMGQ